MKIRLSVTFAGLLWISIGWCDVTYDMQTWFNVTATGNFHHDDKSSSRFKYWLEAQQRNGSDSSRFTQTLLRPGLGYGLTPNTSIWLGYAWVHTGEPLTSNPFSENRIWQQLLWVKTHPYATLSNRLRTEQRFQENRHKASYRIREQMKISVPFPADIDWRFVSSDEVFWHLNNGQGFDQNRFFIGLGYKVSPILTTEFGYMNQYIRRHDVPNFMSNIISINFLMNMD